MGNKPTKDFFKTLATKEARKNISTLKTTFGQSTNQEDINNEFMDQYNLVFQIQGITRERKTSTQKCLNLISEEA